MSGRPQATVVPRWMLVRIMEEGMKRPKHQCTFCGGSGPLREDHIIFTRDFHSAIDGEYDVRVCKRCQTIFESHWSYLPMKGRS